jgi:hypothetical protein
MNNKLLARARYAACVGIALAMSLLEFGMGSAFSDQDSLKRRFDAEYESAIRRLELVYRNIQMDIAGRKYSDGNLREERTITFLAGEDRLRADVERVGDLSKSVYVASPSLSFDLKRKTPGSAFEISEADTTMALHIQNSEWIRRNCKLPFAAVSILERPISEFMKDKQFQITGITEIPSRGSDGANDVRVDWKNPFQDDQGNVRNRGGWFLFSPARGWALKEYEFWTKDPKQVRLRGEIEYGEVVNGVPIPKKATLLSVRNDAEAVLLESQELVRFRVGTSPSSEFQLANFGIPDAVVAGNHHGAGSGRILVLLGVIGLIASVLVLFLVRRRAGRAE